MSCKRNQFRSLLVLLVCLLSFSSLEGYYPARGPEFPLCLSWVFLTKIFRSGPKPKVVFVLPSVSGCPGSDGSVAKRGLGLGWLQSLNSRATSLVLFGSSRMAGNEQRGALQKHHLGSKMFRVFRCLLCKQRNSFSCFY